MQGVKTERALLISKLVMWAGILLGILAIVGELLGWWNDVGELMLTAATVLGAIGGLTALIIGSSSDQVHTVHHAVQENGATLRSVDGRLQSVDRKLGSVDGKLGKLDELDVIQAELDQQTGAMDRQLEVLGQIRDRL